MPLLPPRIAAPVVLFITCLAAARSSPPVGPPVGPPAPPPAQPQGPGTPGTGVIQSSFPDEPRIEIARRLLSSGKFNEAKVVLETVLKQRPQIGRAEFYLGITLSKLKQYEDARKNLEASLAKDQPFPERKHIQHFLGWANYNLGDLGRAKAAFELHLMEVPDEPDSIFGLGLIDFDEDRLDDAEKRFEKAIEMQQGPKANGRDVSKAWARLGDISMRRDDATKAETRYMRAAELFPNHYEAWAKLARARDRLGKTKEAESARNEERRAMERAGKMPLAPDSYEPWPTPPVDAGKPAPETKPLTKPESKPETKPAPAKESA